MRRLVEVTGRSVGRLAEWAAVHRGLVAVLSLLPVVFLVLLAPRLRVDPSLRRLLPEDLPSQRALREAESRIPLASPMFIAVSSSQAERTAQVVHALARRLRAWPHAKSVTERRDPSFFLERRLLYAPADLLEELAESLEARLDWEQCARIPGCVHLEEEPPQVSVRPLERFFLEDRRIAGLLRLLGSEPERLLSSRGGAGAEGTQRAAPIDGRLCTKEGRTCVVQVLLDVEGSNVRRSSALMADVRALALHVLREDLGWSDARTLGFDALEAPSHAVRVQVRGRIRNLVASRAVLREDLRRTSLGALAFVLVVLLQVFRSGRAMVLLFVPMLAGFAGALAVLVLGGVRLNLVSAATLSVLVGIGVDFGIHLTVHHAEALHEGRGVPGAVRVTWQRLLGSLLAAALTTAVGFGALLGTSFQGFAQMGQVALLGVLSVFLAYVVGYPVLAGALGRGGAWLRPSLGRGMRQAPRFARWIVVCVGVVGLVAGGLLAPRLGYETDYRALQPSLRGRFAYARALHGTERSPVLVLADDEGQLRRAVARLRREHPDGLDGEGPGWLVSPDLFVPEEQARKLRVVARMRETVEELLRGARGRDRARLEELSSWLRPRKPVTPESLPPWVHDLLSDRKGRFGTFAVAYARMRSTDAAQMQELASVLAQWRARYTVRFASFGAMLGEVQRSLRADTPRVVAVALLGLLLVTAIVGRSLVRAAWVAVALLVSAGMAVASLVLFGVRPNLYNVPVLPVAFGLGVDGAIYVAWTLWRGRTGGAPQGDALHTVRRAVYSSTMTTLVAFGALLLADSPGLRTLGTMAMVTLASTLFVNLFWLPSAMRISEGRS